MGERPDQIERHIRNQREELGDNINELERKVKNAFDWRTQFEERPGTMLGLAFAGGVLLSAALPKSSSITSRVTSRRRSFSDPWTPYTNSEMSQPAEGAESKSGVGSDSSGMYSGPSKTPGPSSETWNNLKNAAIGLATTRLAEFVEELVPGFSEHYKKAAGSKPPTRYADVRRTADEGIQRANGGTDYSSHS